MTWNKGEIQKSIEIYKEKCLKLKFLKDEKEKKEEERKKQIEFLECATKARAILQKIAQDTQEQVKTHLCGLVNMALDVVFEETYKFGIEFVQRRNTIEADVFLEENDKRLYNPLGEVGLGVCEVIGSILKITLWKLKKGLNNLIILDEPSSSLHSEESIERLSGLFKNISNELHVY